MFVIAEEPQGTCAPFNKLVELQGISTGMSVGWLVVGRLYLEKY